MQELEFSKNSSSLANFVAERSFVYGTLAACLQYPDELLTESINSGTLLKGLKSIFDFEKDLALAGDDARGLAAKVTLVSMESGYTRLFIRDRVPIMPRWLYFCPAASFATASAM